MVSPLEEGGIKEAIYAENNIIIIDYKLQSILPPQLYKMSTQYKVRCGCELCVSAKIINSPLISLRDCYFRKLNNFSQNAQNRNSGENSNHLFETYKISVIPHGRHIYAKSADIAMAIMCAYPPY